MPPTQCATPFILRFCSNHYVSFVDRVFALNKAVNSDPYKSLQLGIIIPSTRKLCYKSGMYDSALRKCHPKIEI